MDTAAGTGLAHRDEALAFVRRAVDETVERLPDVDREAMALVMLLHRVTNSIVYDLESTVHRPAGWSWSAFRLAFTLWVNGPCEPSRLAELAGMSRQATSALVKTLEADGVIERHAAVADARSVVLSLTADGTTRLEHVFRLHNRREAEWAGALDDRDRAVLVDLLTQLAVTAQEDWVNHRF